ncbi:MAG: DUF3568 domain-containing protein [Syntrophales bacterium]|nr:DUF3568 domain-containing protein [Syntrophales bacterium]
MRKTTEVEMRYKPYLLRGFVILVAVLTAGCPAAVVGTAVVGTGTGTYMFVHGELKTDYYHPFDKVWAAVEKTVATMQGTDVAPSKSIASGTITAMINNEKVTINVTYKDKNVTTVGVRIGVFGDEPAAKMIHGKISDNLKK